MMEDFWGELLLVAYWLFVVGITFRVIWRRRAIGVSHAWIALVVLLPIGGPILYLLVGENRLGSERAARARELREPLMRWLITLATERDVDWSQFHPASASLERLGTSLVGLPALNGNLLKLLDDSEDALRSMIRDIDASRSTCHFEFYIWSNGGMADEVVEALVRAAQRGVRCRILVDALGSKRFLRSKQASQLRDAGVNVRGALPVGMFRGLFRRLDLRLHRKIAVIDGLIGYTGSLNLVDPRFFKQDEDFGEWIDTMVRVEGPSVEALNAIFLADWRLDGAESIEELRRTGDLRPADDAGPTVVQAFPSGPQHAPGAIHQMLLSTVYAARRELIMTTPYFVPDAAMLTALVTAARRGVDVTIVVPRKVNSFLVRYASASTYDELLAAGVRILLYEGGLLHSKTVTVDRSIGLIGSVNLDMRSFWLNFELTLFVYCPNFTQQIVTLQNDYMESCEPLDEKRWLARSRGRRVAENVLRLFSPVL